MLITLDAPVIGEKYVTGLWVPDSYSMGDTSSAPEIKAIDLLSTSLDSRVTYSGPPHSYIGTDGKLKQSALNEWPLEYKNGAPVGRHQPEPAATNYVPGVEYTKISRGGTTDDWNYGGAATPVIAPSDFGPAAATTTPTGTLTAVYSEATSTFIGAAQDGGSSSTWKRITRKFTNPSQAMLRWYVSRVDANDYLLARCSSVPAGQYIASVYRKTSVGGLLSAAAQLESGSVATSPIISPQGQQASRAASSVSVKRDGKASSVTVIFNTGEKLTIPFNNAESVSVPVSSLDWGTRFMTRIQYEA